ncbi:MAG: protein jag [Ruminococcaceae bacterium]|nr:protein jag [Oscillospiraceae bacterium]
MKKEIIATGKTIEEALANAAEQLSVSSDEITYEVIDEPKKGLFGIGATPAKIKAVYTLKGEDIALDFIKKLVSDMQLNVTVEMKEATDRDGVLIDIQGEGAGILIGHHGDTLDSIQYLANLAANKKVDGEKRAHVKVTVDAENYRAKREETLRSLARRMADKVLKYKKSVMLEPMNPYERRIIHSEIQGISGVSTNSIGSENNRKIVIYLEDQKAAAKHTEDEDYDY